MAPKMTQQNIQIKRKQGQELVIVPRNYKNDLNPYKQNSTGSTAKNINALN